MVEVHLHESISMSQIQAEEVFKTGSNSAGVHMFKYMDMNIAVLYLYMNICLFLRMYLSVCGFGLSRNI